MLSNDYPVIYIAKPDYINELCAELDDVSDVIGNLVFSQTKKPDVCFALDVWYPSHITTFNSISEAVTLLRQTGKLWYLNPIANIRRSRLIESQLRKLPDLKQHFPIQDIFPQIGCFSLLDKTTLVSSANRWKNWPMGQYDFIEDKKNPPNRAYLKLWEALTLLNLYPKAGEKVLDLGASPGGWTYVMQSFGTHVTAVDKALLEPRVAKLPNIQFLKQSAFSLNPKSWNQPIDWLLSDIACYPHRLYPLVEQWLATGKVKHMIVTIKLQGQTDLDMIKQFQAIPQSRTLHLFHNKHEATFFYPAPPHLFPQF